LTESPSYAYCEYVDNIPDRLSYGENHPERKEFYRVLEESSRNKKFELCTLDELSGLVEEKINPVKDCPNETFNYLGLEDIESNTGRATFRKMFGQEILSVSKRFYKGNIVFAGLRPYLNKVHLVEIDEGIGSAELFVIKPREELVMPTFLLKYLLSDLTLIQTKWILTGCSYPRLNLEDFKNLKIIHPEKEVQRQILDEIKPFEAKAQQKEEYVKTLKDKCRNIILEMLGIKMPTPPTFTSTIYDYYVAWADEHQERLDFIFHHPWMNEIRKLLASLKTIKLGEIIEPQIEYGITTSTRERGSIPFINIHNLGIDGRLKTKDIGYIDSAEDSKLVRNGDILLSRSRLVGVCSLVTNKEEGFSFGSYILRLRVLKDSNIPPEYIVSFINSDLGQAQIRMLETGAFGKNINTRQLKEVKIPLPDTLADINQIVSEIQKLWKELENAENEAELLWLQSGRKFEELLLQ
jgi:restriction endonuclease S subunit